MTNVNEENARMLRIADLRDRVSRGIYVVDPLAVADALLRRLGVLFSEPGHGPDEPQIGCS
jgi:anti-sigma28 factor (negative regulator of flagellin synthesis)